MTGYIKLTDPEENGYLNLSVVETVETPKLEDLQEVVGGYIEAMFTVPSPFRKTYITGYVNEEGLVYNLPILAMVNDEFGQRPFAGNMVVTGLSEDGITTLLNAEEIEYISTRFLSRRYLDLLMRQDEN
jgi:hypothetical protein